MATITAPPPPTTTTQRPGQPPTNSTTPWPPPALFMKMEFGISLAPTSTHNLSLSYASRPITTSRLAKTIPTFLLPSRRRGLTTKKDARPSLRSRSEILMRPSTRTPAYQQYTMLQPSYPHPERPATQRTSSLNPNYAPHLSWGPTRHFLEHKPLPELPSRFRLGEPDLPWSSPAPSIRSTTTAQTTSTRAAGPSSDPVWSAVSPPSATWAAPRSVSNPPSPIVSPDVSFAYPPQPPHHHHTGSGSVSPASPADAAPGPKPWRDTSFYTSIPGPRSITPPHTHRARAVSASDRGTDRVSEGGERESVRDYEAEVRARDETWMAIDPLREWEMHNLQAAMMSFDALGEWDETTASVGMNAAPASNYPHDRYMDQWNNNNSGRSRTVGWAEDRTSSPHDLGWAVGVGEDGRMGVVRDDEAGWQRYNFEEWDRAGKGWSYRDVNGFTSS
ncbi:hypothetical protein VC83_07175 [Pseudogymnoascus destructans]|uniref:Uncharacterized protein n=2 Tax=Pseudogymnoascus destructans TaxID=655981 RepID=L8FNF5_PSED2|nr:uncharacterized protein VC83_07175 [Pseudogymnoascus destructans]ELR02442.1 hypothetical protein GMDG_05497 [Pseudogymnoascus destructans 20631-21]OAF56702.1 hypothetical protein VC83_07175 [Pseudogymnoascus destructans]